MNPQRLGEEEAHGARISTKSRMSKTPLGTRESLDTGSTHELSLDIRLVNEGVRQKRANYEWL